MKVIAIAGKGGTGKTTVAILLIRWLRANRSKSILAVDADPAANLGEMMGVVPKATVGAIREEMRSQDGGFPGGMTRQQFLEYKIHTSLVETPDFDLISMGRPEGPGCYCYANNLLRDIMDTLGGNYAHVVIDNEAGMEHISRRTTHNVDYLLLVSNPTAVGVRTAGKISKLADELAVGVREKYLILNRVADAVPQPVGEAIADVGLRLVGSIPEDSALVALDRSGEPIWPVLLESRAYMALGEALDGLIGN